MPGTGVERAVMTFTFSVPAHSRVLSMHALSLAYVASCRDGLVLLALTSTVMRVLGSPRSYGQTRQKTTGYGGRR